MIVPYNKIELIASWCVANIGPRQYWINGRLGGKGWKMERSQDEWLLTVDDEAALTMLLLKVAI